MITRSGVSPLVGATYFRLGIAALLLFLTIVPVLAANDTVTVDVIYVGRGDSINSNIGENIESLVASGEILIISDANYRYFGDSLPVRLVGSSRGSSSIRVTDPTAAVSQQIFSGLNTTFPARISVDDRDQYAALKGAVTLLSFSNGDPALAYGRYGNGFVIVWMPSAIDPYIDRSMVSTINDRLIAYLGPSIVKITTVATTIVPANTTRVTTIPTAVHTTIPVESTSTPAITPLPTTAGTTAVPQSLGTVSVYSSPLGANVFIEGVYRGKTPVTLSDVTPGYHALKLALTGYYDYDATIYVMGGGTITAFGALPPHETIAVISTPTPTPTAVNTTATPVPILESPSIIAGILGIFTAIIGAGATLFSIYYKNKKV